MAEGIQMKEDVTEKYVFTNAKWEEAMSSEKLHKNWSERCKDQVGYRNTLLYAPNSVGSYVYEIGVKLSDGSIVSVYVGCTIPGGREISYMCGGSHLSKPINAVLEQKLTILMRKVHLSDPKKVEQEILAKYDYAWNKKNLGRNILRPLKRRGHTLSE